MTSTSSTSPLQTHGPRPVPEEYAEFDRLPERTPVVGDRIQYQTDDGEVLTAEQALEHLRLPAPLLYTTWEA